MKRAMPALLLVATLLGAWQRPALAWGSSGHSVVAEIAQRLISAQAHRTITDLLGDSGSLAAISNWADTIAEERPQTRSWHFVNIPYEAAGYDAARDCGPAPGDSCIVGAMLRLRGVLADRRASQEARADALRFLVHLVGDAHQPLHCAQRDHDNGGSTVQVRFRGQATSLHKLWDFELLDAWSFDWGEHVHQVMRQLPADTLPADPAQWVSECHRLAVEVAYDVPLGGTIDEIYEQRAKAAVYRQLGLAGQRLARLLGEALR